MGLGNFFAINMPYGIKRNSKNERVAFNQEYMPLGWNSKQLQQSIFSNETFSDLPIYTKYKGLTEKELMKLVDNKEYIILDADGKIEVLYLHQKVSLDDKKVIDRYFDKLKKLSKFEEEIIY